MSSRFPKVPWNPAAATNVLYLSPLASLMCIPLSPGLTLLQQMSFLLSQTLSKYLNPAFHLWLYVHLFFSLSLGAEKNNASDPKKGKVLY